MRIQHWNGEATSSPWVMVVVIIRSKLAWLEQWLCNLQTWLRNLVGIIFPPAFDKLFSCNWRTISTFLNLLLKSGDADNQKYAFKRNNVLHHPTCKTESWYTFTLRTICFCLVFFLISVHQNLTVCLQSKMSQDDILGNICEQFLWGTWTCRAHAPASNCICNTQSICFLWFCTDQ